MLRQASARRSCFAMPSQETHPPSAAAHHAPATLRNREPILFVLRDVLPPAGTVLEIASGSGEHATYFAQQLAPLLWQPTDYSAEAVASIAAWRDAEDGHRPLPPRQLDVTASDWGLSDVADLRALFCANMIHIAPWEAALGLLAGAGQLLPSSGTMVLYGPYKRDGAHTSDSNAEFDATLRSQDPSWGIRDLEEITTQAATNGLILNQTIQMPANNFILVFNKT